METEPSTEMIEDMNRSIDTIEEEGAERVDVN